MNARRVEHWGDAGIALAAIVAIGHDPERVLWAAGVPWVPAVYQTVAVHASDLALAALVLWGLWRGGLCRRFERAVAVPAAILLLGLLASCGVALAPQISLAMSVRVALGMLAAVAVARRPPLAHWLAVWGGVLLLAQLPLVAAQQLTQSTFPAWGLFHGWPELAAAEPGAAVVIGPDGLRWQRALGSFPHPNVLGGFLAIALVLCLPWLGQVGRWRALVVTISAVGWLELVFTFSRGGLLAVAVGCGMWALGRAPWRAALKLAVPPLLALAVGALLVGPLLVARLVPTGGLLRERPVADRLLLARVASQLIAAQPLRGVGAGNFALAELQPPFNAVSVEPVHNVPLLVAAEAGIPAGIAWLAVLLLPPALACWRRRDVAPCCWQYLALPATLATIAALDHYLWSLALGQAIFWLALGIWSARDRSPDSGTPRCHDASGARR